VLLQLVVLVLQQQVFLHGEVAVRVEGGGGKAVHGCRIRRAVHGVWLGLLWVVEGYWRAHLCPRVWRPKWRRVEDARSGMDGNDDEVEGKRWECCDY
jgi:hypothetical protein